MGTQMQMHVLSKNFRCNVYPCMLLHTAFWSHIWQEHSLKSEEIRQITGALFSIGWDFHASQNFILTFGLSIIGVTDRSDSVYKSSLMQALASFCRSSNSLLSFDKQHTIFRKNIDRLVILNPYVFFSIHTVYEVILLDTYSLNNQ